MSKTHTHAHTYAHTQTHTHTHTHAHTHTHTRTHTHLCKSIDRETSGRGDNFSSSGRGQRSTGRCLSACGRHTHCKSQRGRRIKPSRTTSARFRRRGSKLLVDVALLLLQKIPQESYRDSPAHPHRRAPRWFGGDWNWSCRSAGPTSA